MADIADKVAQIRQAVYGKDVRENIASGIEAINIDAESAVSTANNAIPAMNQIKADTQAIKDQIPLENATAEIIDARGGFDTLGHKLESLGVNVIDYGAVADGVTDCLTAFNNAANTGNLVLVPKGSYLISAATTSATWVLDKGAIIVGLTAITSGASNMPDTSRLTGRVIDLNSKAGLYGFKFGDPDHWLERDITGATEILSEVSILASNGQIALTTATRTSDNTPANMSGIAHASFAINDNITNPEVAYSEYLEAQRSVGAGTTFASESDVINFGDTIDLNPYSGISNNTGATVNHWLGSGGGKTGANNTSAAIVLIPNSKKFRRGIVFNYNSLDTAINEAIAMGYAQKIAWYNADGTVKGYLDGSRAADLFPGYFVPTIYNSQDITVAGFVTRVGKLVTVDVTITPNVSIAANTILFTFSNTQGSGIAGYIKSVAGNLFCMNDSTKSFVLDSGNGNIYTASALTSGTTYKIYGTYIAA